MPSKVWENVSDSDAGAERDASSPDGLIARAAHELRGPLGAIANWVHVLSQAGTDAALREQGLAAIQGAVLLSTRLIDELCDVALLRSGRLQLRTGLVDLVPLVEMALEKPRASAREKGVELELVREVPSMPVIGDPDRLQQIVLHLLGNAVKFTPGGGRVELRLGRSAACWQLAVSDTGPGLAPEVLERIFGGLRPEDFATPRAPASLGVGLTIVHCLAELHGGSVEASSPGPGGGARFVVRLPVPPAATLAPGDASSSAKDEPSRPAGLRVAEEWPLARQPPRFLPGG